MSNERLYQIIRGAHSSEKASMVVDKSRAFVFSVETSASKPEIRLAVEQLFKVKVKSVSTLNMKGKCKKFGRMVGRRNQTKKAYVTLQEGYDIEFAVSE